MSRIINNQGNVLHEDNDSFNVYVVLDYLEEQGESCTVYDTLSDLMKTMTGDSETPFNSIRELLEYTPDIIDCGEETHTVFIYGSGIYGYIMEWNNEDSIELANKILKDFYPELKIVED